MRTVTYGAACSLDGFIAGNNDTFDWMHFSRDVEEVMAQYWSTVDAVLMGRRTWEFAAAQGMGDEPASASNEGSGIPAVTTYLFSRTLAEARKAWNSSPPMPLGSSRGSSSSRARESA